MAAWNVESGDAPENFEDLLREDDGDVSDLDEEMEYLDEENEENQTMELGVYEEHGSELPVNFDIPYLPVSSPASPPPASPPPASSHQSPESLHRTSTAEHRFPERPVGSGLHPVTFLAATLWVVILLCAYQYEVVAFHLADEHGLFAPVDQVDQVTEQPLRGRGRRRGQRQRGRGGRARRPEGWVRGDSLTEVFLTDDDVPEDLRAQIMRVVADREARLRSRTAANRRREDDDEYVDADDGGDEALFAGDRNSTVFEWSSMDTYQGQRESFLPQQIGPTVASESPYGAFRQYWDDSILSHIVTETNRYAAEVAASSNVFARGWYDTNVHELLILFSFWMMLGIIRMPSTKSCFTLNPLLKTNVFRTIFSRKRYENLCRALHFTDNSNRPTDDSNRLFCFGPILDHLNARFQSAYVPSQQICIDESLILWKGNLSFRQYIKTKAARFGVKTFELCESATGYLWSFFIYTGRTTSYDPAFPSSLLKSTATVLKLVHPLLDKGYTLFMDNWFNSPLLARFLKNRGTDCVGTLRSNRSNVSPLISLCRLREGQIAARHSGDVSVMAFQDRKKIMTISTFHGTSQNLTEPKPHRPIQYKPQVILDYNKGMGGVDRKDQMLEPYLLERKRCAKWHMKVFKRLLNCSILNSRILLQASTGTFKEHIVFRLELVQLILQHHLQHVPQKPSGSNVTTTPSASRMTSNRHWPKQITRRLRGAPDSTARRRCFYCTTHNRTQRRTSYVCSVCDVPLCVEPCFQYYHTLP